MIAQDSRADCRTAFPIELQQEPLFRLPGTSAADKKRVLYAVGHDLPLKERIREELDWFDKYLGLVRGGRGDDSLRRH